MSVGCLFARTLPRLEEQADEEEVQDDEQHHAGLASALAAAVVAVPRVPVVLRLALVAPVANM
jgi:hypothetical protein